METLDVVVVVVACDERLIVTDVGLCCCCLFQKTRRGLLVSHDLVVIARYCYWNYRTMEDAVVGWGLEGDPDAIDGRRSYDGFGGRINNRFRTLLLLFLKDS